MHRQRPVRSLVRNAGAVACLALVGVLVGCTPGSVSVDTPDLSGADETACTNLVDALPDAVSDKERRPVDPEDAYAAAWGDPAIVLRCGVPAAQGFDDTATCQLVNGVGWFVPQEQIEDQSADVVMTTIGRTQNVEVTIPAGYRPPAAAMVDLAPAVKRAIREIKPC